MKVRNFIDNNWNWLSLLIATAALVATIIYVYVSTPAFTYLQSNDRDIIEKSIHVLENKNGIDFIQWYKLNISAHVILIIVSVLAAATAAYTTSENIHRFNVWTIIFTTLTAGISSGLSTFHVHRNLHHFATIESKLDALDIRYAIKRGDLSIANESSHAVKTLPIMAGSLSPAAKKKIVIWAWTRLMDLDRQRMLAYANIEWNAKTNVPKSPIATDNGGGPKIPGNEHGTKKVAGHL